MSFILDALRKSESERQRDAAASLSRAPLAVVRQRTPVWSWILIGCLSLLLVAITAVWWRGDRDGVTSGTALSAMSDTAVAENTVRQSPAAERRPADNRPLPATTTTSEATTRPAPSASLVPPPIRPARELSALIADLPRLRLELLAYDGRNPNGGSAWINGQRYAVGERVANGPELVEVRPDGVILAYDGQRFLLTTR